MSEVEDLRGSLVEVLRQLDRQRRKLDLYRNLARHAYGLLRQKKRQKRKVLDVVFYDCGDSERFTHTDLGDAINDHLDSLDVQYWPEKLEIKAYRFKDIPKKDKDAMALRIVERLMEELDEEYGDPDEPADLSRKEAAEVLLLAYELVDTICAYFPVWSCEEAKKLDELIDVADWVREFSPEWLEEKEIREFVEKSGGTGGG